jgi:type II secretory ATPase GspE/PulE/Tfp pilus assembly ATPase PilB-like protein
MDVGFLDYLRNKERISEEKYNTLIAETENSKETVLSLINKHSLLDEEILIPDYADYISFPYIFLKDLRIDKKVIDDVPAKYAIFYQIAPFKYESGNLCVALADPYNISKIDELKLLLGKNIKPYLSGERDLSSFLKERYGIGAETVQSISENDRINKTVPFREKSVSIDQGGEASIIKFVNQLLYEAYKDRATDIHIEPFDDELRVRYRIDGILFNVPVPGYIKNLQDSIISRIKVIAGMNIAERRMPQDGKIEIKVNDATLDLRVSTLPTPYGETISLRLLTERAKLFDLEALGFSKADLAPLSKIISKPHGIVLLTGPTGSGKTTTLYSFLRKLNSKEVKILTVEDPIEYQLKGISQMQVHPQIGFTFANALRYMLRHDPDIMMVGEIRDVETAEIAIRVSLTGHLVFSTLHTIDSVSAVTRLAEMGIEPYLISSSVECVIAQRLVRMICDDCKRELKAPGSVLKTFGEKEKVKIYKGAGCPKCKMTGYRGRTAIYEIFSLNEDIREMIVNKAPVSAVRKKAAEDGMTLLKQNGWEKAKNGITTVEEILKVTQEEI